MGAEVLARYCRFVSALSPQELSLLSSDPLPYFDHDDASVRRLAVSVAAAEKTRAGLDDALVVLLQSDPSDRVRAEAAEVLATTGPAAFDALLTATDDVSPIVVEAAMTGLGEIKAPAAVPLLIDAAQSHKDRLVREAAVASLGAIADERALQTLLDLVAKGPPRIRRRSVVALTVFDGPDVEAAIRGALTDRNPMVREAAEMVAGRPVE